MRIHGVWVCSGRYSHFSVPHKTRLQADMDPGMTDVHTLLREYTTGYVKAGGETCWPMVQEVRYVSNLADVPTEFVTDVGIALELRNL